MLKVAQPKNQAAPRTRPPTHTAKMQQGTTKSRKSQGPMPTGKTRQPTMQNHKGPARTPMEKTHQAIIQGRKDRAQPAARRARDRVLRKAPAPREPRQDPADTKYGSCLKEQPGCKSAQPVNTGFSQILGESTGLFHTRAILNLMLAISRVEFKRLRLMTPLLS